MPDLQTDSLKDKVWLPLALFIGAAIYFTPLELIGLNLYDEGIRLLGAERVLHGAIPYRDFYALYGPAQFYWPALLFKLFGAQVIALRISSIACNAVAAAAVFVWCRKIGVSTRGSLLAYCGFLLPRNRDFLDGALDPSIALILLAGVALLSEYSKRRQLIAGTLIGSAALFRHDFGACALAGAVFACTVEETVRQGRWSLPPRRSIHGITWLLVGFLLTAGAGYGILAVIDWRALTQNLVQYPAEAMAYRRLPPFKGVLGDLRHIPWDAPIRAMMASIRMLVYPAVPITLAVSLWVGWKRMREALAGSRRLRMGVAFFVLILFGFAVYGFGRSDWPHLLPFYLMALPWIAMLAHVHQAGRPGQYRWIRVRRVALITALLAGALTFVTSVQDYRLAPSFNLEKARGIAVSGDTRWIADAVKDLGYDAGPIFVASERHDRVFVNAVGIYFLSERSPGSYFTQFDPGITTTEPVQRSIIADLQKNNVRTVFVWRSSLPDEPNPSAVSSGVRLLDDYLADTYTEVKDEPEYRILKR